MKVINRFTGQTVRIGSTFVFPGDMQVEVIGFAGTDICFSAGGTLLKMPMAFLGLQWQSAPSERMTRDDWIHATNNAKELGGHFAGNLARAYQHADSDNVAPIKKAYHALFFTFLSLERQNELKAQD